MRSYERITYDRNCTILLMAQPPHPSPHPRSITAINPLTLFRPQNAVHSPSLSLFSLAVANRDGIPRTTMITMEAGRTLLWGRIFFSIRNSRRVRVYTHTSRTVRGGGHLRPTKGAYECIRPVLLFLFFETVGFGNHACARAKPP